MLKLFENTLLFCSHFYPQCIAVYYLNQCAWRCGKEKEKKGVTEAKERERRPWEKVQDSNILCTEQEESAAAYSINMPSAADVVEETKGEELKERTGEVVGECSPAGPLSGLGRTNLFQF